MICIQYRERDIVYLEVYNEWMVDCNGLQRRFRSLALAKAAVDAVLASDSPNETFVAFAIDTQRKPR